MDRIILMRRMDAIEKQNVQQELRIKELEDWKQTVLNERKNHEKEWAASQVPASAAIPCNITWDEIKHNWNRVQGEIRADMRTCPSCAKVVRCPGMCALGEQGTECTQYVAKESV